MKEFVDGSNIKVKGFKGSNSIYWFGNEIGYEEDSNKHLVTITYYLR